MQRVSAFLILMVASLLPVTAEAGLLSSLGRLADSAGDAGGVARKADGIGGSDLPASALRAAKDPNTTPLALGVDADGSVRLTDELGRAFEVPATGDVDALLKAASNGAKQLAVIADARTLARAGDVATALAERGVLRFWHDKTALPVRMSGGAISVEPRAGLVMPLVQARRLPKANVSPVHVRVTELRELNYAMDKALNRGTVVVAELGKPVKGPRRVGFGDGPSGKLGKTVKASRDDLLAGFSGNRGGTVILSGRIRNDAIAASGGSVPLSEIRAAAAAADVHLVLLDGPARAAHKALEQATTYGDLLTGMAPKGGAIAVNAQRLGENRVRLSMAPEINPLTVPEPVAPTVADDVAQVAATGLEFGVRALVHGIELETRDRSFEQDLSMRLIPWVPYWAHVIYVLNLIMGLYGGRYAWRLWRRLWPMRPRPRWFAPAHYPRFLVFLLIFLPLTGFVWAIIAFFAGIGNTIMSILRLVGLAKRRPA